MSVRPAREPQHPQPLPGRVVERTVEHVRARTGVGVEALAFY